MKKFCRGVLKGLVSFCKGVKKSCSVYGMEDESLKLKHVIVKGKKKSHLFHIEQIPDNLPEDFKRIRSLNVDLDRLGYDPLVLKFYKTEMKSKNVFE